MPKKGLLAVVAVALAITFVIRRGPHSGVDDLAHEAVRLHLGFFGSSIYEYHATTGRWPTKLDDLEMTSLPEKSPYWRSWFVNEAFVIIWHKNLKPNPKDNAGHILAYHDKGLIAEQGRSWVCWADLRTEYIKTEDLKAYLAKLKD